MLADAIEKAGQANAVLLRVIEDLQATQRVNDQLVITSAMRALRRCIEADGLNPSARKEVQSAYRMCKAAMGLE